MKTGLTKKQKVTEFYFNERDDLAEIYTHNADLKKRLLAYAKKHLELCKLTEENEHSSLWFEIDKHRIGIRLPAPCSLERRVTSREQGAVLFPNYLCSVFGGLFLFRIRKEKRKTYKRHKHTYSAFTFWSLPAIMYITI